MNSIYLGVILPYSYYCYGDTAVAISKHTNIHVDIIWFWKICMDGSFVTNSSRGYVFDLQKFRLGKQQNRESGGPEGAKSGKSDSLK